MSETTNICACRVCFDTKCVNGVLLDEESGWVQLLEYCVGLFITPEDEPRMLCAKCADHVKNYDRFKKQCHKADQFWKSLKILDVECNLKKVSLDSETKTEYNPAQEENVNKYDSCNDSDGNYIYMSDNQPQNEFIVSDDKDTSVQQDIKEFHDENISGDYIKAKAVVKVNEPTHDNRIDEKIICSICQKEFEYNNDHMSHLKTCRKNKTNKQSQAKKENKTNKHKDKSPLFHCGLCDFTTPDSATGDQHVAKHITDNDLNCKLCDFIGRDAADMVSHRFTHHPKSFSIRLICHLCQKRSASLLSLQYHYRSQHLDKNGGWCTFCSKEFRVYKTWKHHERRHKLNRFICDLCGKSFLYKNDIVGHLIDHSDIRIYICEACGKGFKRNSNLKLHMETIHKKHEPIKCTHCNKVFKNPMTYGIHTKMLSKEKPFKCEVCSKYYASLNQLKKHMFWHTGERPHSCTICGSKYKAKCQLKVHMRNHTGDRPFQCTQCDKAFVTARQLRVHTSVHTGVRPHKCGYCERTFNSRKLVLAHRLLRHKVNK